MTMANVFRSLLYKFLKDHQLICMSASRVVGSATVGRELV